ncbi:MAG: calcium-binding protein, partial [Cyanobacteria bacterium P01_F01_bin.3]
MPGPGPLSLFSEEIFLGAKLLMFGNNEIDNFSDAELNKARDKADAGWQQGELKIDESSLSDVDKRIAREKNLQGYYEAIKILPLRQSDIDDGLKSISDAFKTAGKPYYVDTISSPKEGVTKNVGIADLSNSSANWTEPYGIARNVKLEKKGWATFVIDPNANTQYNVPQLDNSITSYSNPSGTTYYAYENANYKGEYIELRPYTSSANLYQSSSESDRLYLQLSTKSLATRVPGQQPVLYYSPWARLSAHPYRDKRTAYIAPLRGEYTNPNWSDRISSISVVKPGNVSNGPIDEATIYWDANFNGKIDADELIATSDQGRFLLHSPHERFDTNGDGEFDTTEGRLVATGGTHTLGGMPLRTDLWAPAGSTMITPLTTIVEFLAQVEGLDYDATEALIKEVVGIHADVDIKHFDPVLYLEGNGRLDDATSTYIAHLQVGSLLESITQYLSGALALPIAEVGELAVGVVADGLITMAELDLDLQDIEENHDVFNQAFINHLDASNFVQLEAADTEFIADVFVLTLSFIEEEIATIDTSDGQALLDESALYKPILYTVIPELMHEVGDGALTLETAQERLDKVIAESKDGHVLIPSETGVAVGTVFEETIVGFDGDDTLAGGLGNDQLFGGDGNDVLRGDANSRSSQGQMVGGDDELHGGNGDDRLGGKAGNDRLYGDQGDDKLWGDDGDDLLWGGLGND